MIGIVYVGELKFNPYLKIYTDVLEKNQKKYKVLYWSREKIPPKKPNHIAFMKESAQDASVFKKSKDFLEFRMWLIAELKKFKFDKLILLSTLSGVLIENYVTKNYKNKYLFDIRDYSYENIKIFKKTESNVIENSYSTFISSRGFKKFLPEGYQYKTIHNFNEESGEPIPFKKNKSLPINIVWVGGVRYFEHQKHIIKALCNDSRFVMNYYGFGPEIPLYKKYITEIGAKNVKFHGEYNNSDKKYILEKADILNNSYVNVNKVMETKYALSNKVYDGIFFTIPQLVESETYKADLIEEHKIGISIDPMSYNYADKLYYFYKNINEKEFTKSIKYLANVVLEENMKIRSVINDFIL